MRSSRRSLLVSVLGLLVGGLSVSSASATQPSRPDTAVESPSVVVSLKDGPLVAPSVDELLGGEGAGAARQARRSNPQAVAQRAAARTRFQSLTPAAAASAAKAAFPDLIDHPAGAVTLGPGQRIVRYPTNHAAQVSLPGGTDAVIESLAPIASKTAHGTHIPFDLRLADAGGHFAPVRSNVSLRVPRKLADGISLQNAGVSLTPIDAHGSALKSSTGAIDGASVLWATPQDAATAANQDLATIAKALPQGFDLTTMLLSTRSPGQLYFRVGMPAGAHLKHAANGSLQVIKAAKTLAVISPVSAQDAEGTNVPVTTAVHGDTIAATVDRSGDYLYPIAVDPEINDSQLAKTTAGKRSNWEFFTSNATRFQGTAVYEGPGVEHLEIEGIAPYVATEYAYWGYQTHGVSHIYEIKTETSAKNKLAKIESFLEFLAPSGREINPPKMLSNESFEPEYSKKVVTACAANASKVEECLPTSGKAKNAVHFQQSASGPPGANYKFWDMMSQGIVSIAEPTGTHSTTSYNTTSPTFEFEAEIEGKKEKITRSNVLYGTGSWMTKSAGAFQAQAADTGIGVSKTKLEYESAPGVFAQLAEHDYLEVENACQGVQCYESHSEYWTLPALLPDGEQKLRYRAQEAISGTQSLEGEGQATVKIDTKGPHDIQLNGLPYANELSEKPYELTAEATDGEGSTIASSGIKSIALFIDGAEFGTSGGSCTVAKGACTATRKWTVNGAELGSGKHDIELHVLDNAGNEKRTFEQVSIFHSTPVSIGPGSVDLQSGDFALSAMDVSMGSGLMVGRNYSSRNLTQGNAGPLGPQWSLSLGSTESLVELINGSVLMTSADGSQTIFAAQGAGKFESPTGDSNLELSLEENEAKQKLAYYLKDVAAHTSVKFTQQAGSTFWIPTKQEGTVANHTVTYAYQAGAYVEYAMPSESRPQQIVTGSDGNLWVPLYETGKIAKVTTTTGAVTEYSAGVKQPRDMAVGSDGNVWYTGGTFTYETNIISKMTPTGTRTAYTVPSGDRVINITAGPDGNLWFRAFPVGGTRKIGKITPNGTVTEYSLPSESNPYAITAGPDGNVWFADYPRNKIVRMTPAGSITAEYSLPAGSGPSEITKGPDGNLWFTNEKTKKIGKITTSGTITEYSVPGETNLASSLVAGPDGNMWFTTWGTPTRVGKITTSGTVTTYSLPENNLKGLTVGPDGNMWFSGEYPSKVGTVPISGINIQPTEVLAPTPAGVSCAPELKAGCRALKFKYATSTTATGENKSEWGDFQTRLTEVSLTTYSPAAKAMTQVGVARYSYDKQGRLRAQWDPRISPNLKTIYGYDSENRVTALSPPGQEPWTFSYGPTAGDAGTGRLLKTMRAPASTEPWNGSLPVASEGPKLTGTLGEGVKLAVSNGTWSNGPVSYAYQWKSCNSSGAECKPIAGASNPNYTLQASDVGHTIKAAVTATNGGGSKTGETYTSPIVQSGSAAQFTEYALPTGSAPFGVAAGPDSKVWFTNQKTEKVGKVTPAGAITEYASNTHGYEDNPEGITTGPDGNLWYVESFSHSKAVFRMTTSGTVTEFPLTRAEPWCVGITTGPDGNLWFTEQKTGYIGKMSTAGTVLAEYKLPSGSEPRGITAGPDGNLWFAEYGTKKIGKITTSGTITEYARSAKPENIAAGPDGNLWFTEYSASAFMTEISASKINKITTSGTVTEYALPSDSGPRGITAGSDGNLWFTEFGTDKIGMITTSGTITEYPLASLSDPIGIASGPEGNIWYANSGKSTIGKIGIATGEQTSGALINPQPGSAIEYKVPISGGGAPYSMSGTEVAKWGQKDLPDEATAIFAEDEPQSWPATNYKRATVVYLDEQGRTVNTAKPSTATYGSISTTEYNEFNEPIRTLSANNRATALKAGEASVETSKLLDTQSTFNGEGAKEGEVEEPGTLLIETLGPQHQVKYTAGGEVKESLAREHKKFFYDQGAPATGEKYRLLTETANLAQLANHEEVEVRATRYSYSGQSNLGWKLRAPTSVTVDPEGLKLTTTTEYDSVTGQITQTRGAGSDKTFSYTTKFGETGTENGKLKNPWGVAINSEGKLWVVDSANNRVQKFSSAGVYSSKFGEAGSGNGQFSGPQGIALDSAGHIWVADTGNNRIQEFSSTGTFMASIGSLGSGNGQFKSPSALAFDPKGNLWVTDTGNNRVQKLDKEGVYVSQFGTVGSEPGQLKEPKGIAIDASENVWVADTANNRIQQYTKGGSFIRRIATAGAGEGQLNTPLGLSIDSSGNIWAIDSANNRAESFSPTGAYITQVGYKGTGNGQLTEPRAMAFDSTGKLWITDSANDRLEQWSKGANAHDQKTIYYSAAANEAYPSCGSHPEWAGLVCQNMAAKQPELLALPQLPVTSYAYNMYNEPETVTETFGGSTRTKKTTYDEAGRRATSETTATSGTSLPKVTFTYNKDQGMLEKQAAAGEGTITSEYNRLGQLTQYTDADANIAKFKYFGVENLSQLQEVSDSSNAGASKQTYSYDETTKLRTKLVDSAAGTFTASYDAGGMLKEVQYPSSVKICERYTYNSVGEATGIEYAKPVICLLKGSSPWYTNAKVPSVHGDMLSQSSTLANETYVHDAAGRLSESRETPEGEGCTVRAYAYDEEGNRASSVARAPGGGGACQTEGGTSEGHNYDESNRLADGGMSYDAYGNVTTLPAADAEGHELNSTYYVSNAVASQSQNGVTNNYYLDPEGRTRETVTGINKTISHYDGPGEAVAWTSQGANWTRNIPGLDGMLLATQKNGETPILQLHDLQGNVAATIGDKAGETKLLSTYNSTEFGVPNAGKVPPTFAWLGASGVESALPSGVITYGSTSYVPQTARSLQSEPVEAPGLPGGTGSGAVYTSQQEPWNMQGAAAAGAEAPGLEAAREKAAMEAAEAAAAAAGGAGGGGGWQIGDLFANEREGASASVAGGHSCKVRWKMVEDGGMIKMRAGFLCRHAWPHMEMSFCIWTGYEKKGWDEALCTGHDGLGIKYDGTKEMQEEMGKGCTIGLLYTGAMWVRAWGNGRNAWWSDSPWEKPHPRLDCEGGYDAIYEMAEFLGG
jgi:YD repeat-containing protein